jgi:hypothetical protein
VFANYNPDDLTPVTITPFFPGVLEESMAVDPDARTFSASAPGPVGSESSHYAVLQLMDSNTFFWTVYFPWSVVDENGDTAILHLPALTGDPPLPDFTSPFGSIVAIDLYRLDSNTTEDHMVLWLMNQKGTPFPSHGHAHLNRPQ